jgi:hypothetical protein
VLMVRGADASDVAMITSFGGYQLRYFRVWTDEVDPGLSDTELTEMLTVRPDGKPLIFPSSARAA